MATVLAAVLRFGSGMWSWLKKRGLLPFVAVGVGLLIAVGWAYWHGKDVGRRQDAAQRIEEIQKEYVDDRSEETTKIEAAVRSGDNRAAVDALMGIARAGRVEAADAIKEHSKHAGK